MPRLLLAALVASTLTVTAFAQQGPLQRAGQALDRAGKNIRGEVEGAVARGQLSAQERDLLARVTQRINWDKRLTNSTLQLVVQADGTVYLRGSVPNALAKTKAVEIADNTIGVTRVVDELAIVTKVKVIESRPATPAVIVVPAAVTPAVVKP